MLPVNSHSLTIGEPMPRKLLAAALLVVTAMLTQAGAADAALPTVFVYGRNGTGEIRADGTYNDDTNKFCATDRYGDYHSGLVQYKRQSVDGWTSDETFEVWDHDGADNGSSACIVANYADNAPVMMRVCVGEWSERPQRRVILKDNDGNPWCGAAKKFLS